MVITLCRTGVHPPELSENVKKAEREVWCTLSCTIVGPMMTKKLRTPFVHFSSNAVSSLTVEIHIHLL
jgi:hypothetical protein